MDTIAIYRVKKASKHFVSDDSSLFPTFLDDIIKYSNPTSKNVTNVVISDIVIVLALM